MGVIDQIGSSIASGAASAVGNIPGALVNYGINNLIQDRQVRKSKELLDYQWKNYQSPEAQVKSMAAAGLNPAVTLGGNGSFAAPSASLPTTAPVQIDGVSDMLSSLTQLKKVDKENELVDQEIYKTLSEKGLIDEQRHGQVIANLIAEQYGDKEVAARIANLGGQTALYASQKDLSKAEENLQKLKGETEKVYKDLLRENKLKAALEVKNYQRYIESVISSNNASAKASVASAHESESKVELNQHQLELIDYQKDFQDMVNKVKRANLSSEMLTDLKKMLSDRALSEAQKKEAELRLSHVEAFINARNMSAAWREFDNACNWISSKISASISGSFSSVSKD